MDRKQLEDKIKDILIEEFEVEEDKICPEANIKDDLSIDSLGYVDLVVVIDREFGFKISAADIADIVTLAQFVDYMEGKLATLNLHTQ